MPDQRGRSHGDSPATVSTVTLRTRDLSIQWSPQLKFYEERISTLRRLDEELDLAGFRIDEGSAGAVIRGVGEVVIAPDHLQLRAFSPAYDAERFDRALRIAFEPFEPASCYLVMRYQILEELELSYDDARTAAMATWATALPGTTPVDIAILYDGVDENSGISFQTEFGVVRREEMAGRLRRHHGRMGGSASTHGGLDVDLTDLPATAAFADFTWWTELQRDGSPADSAIDAAGSTLQRSISIAAHLAQTALAGAVANR